MRAASIFIARFLNRRAWNASEGAKYAAVAGLCAQQHSAAGAVIKELTGVGWHRLSLGRAAMGASDG
jgi:hypothetical protein